MATKFNIANLIQESAPAQVGQEEKFQLIPLRDLVENEKNGLFPIEDMELEELTDSIQAVGLTEPLTVTPMGGGRYRIISGHRRSRAIKALAQEHPEEQRWKTVPCYVKTYKTPEDEELALIFANTQVRKDKSYIVPAVKRIRELLIQKSERDGTKYRGKMQGEIAQILQISRQEVQRQEYIAEHLETAIRERWPNLPTQTANTIAHMRPSYQRMLAEKFPSSWGIPTNGNVLEINDSLKRGNDWFAITAERQKKEKEQEEERRQKRQIVEEERKKQEKVYYDRCKKIKERFRLARETAGCEQASMPEEYGVGNLDIVIKKAIEYGVSADYLLGLCDEPNPAPKAPEWKRITEDCQPSTGESVEVITWMGDKWFGARVTWHDDLFTSDLIQMWTAAIPRPEPPAEEWEAQTKIF